MRHLCHSATLGTATSIPADTVAPAPLATTTLALASTLALAPSFGPAPLVGVLWRRDMQLRSGGNRGAQ